jgi:AcrR family transcriptional regulator
MGNKKHPKSKPSEGGLRERKKLETRRALAKTAAKLFRAQGYENVRMIDIAHAADVAEQTLYNYFPTKEHLVFDQTQELEARILAVVLEKPKKMPLAEALRRGAEKFLDELSGAEGEATGIPNAVATGPDLRRVWIEMNANHADSLTDGLLQTGMEDRASAKFLARSIVALFAVILEGVGEAVIAGKSPAAIRKRLSRSIDAIAAMIEDGFSR